MSDLTDLIAETGDHPDSGAFCPGRHRKPWTVAGVYLDAARFLAGVPAPAGAHACSHNREPVLADFWRANALLSATF